MNDFRKLCAELAEDTRYLLGCIDDDEIDLVCIAECREHLGRARAALSEPVVGPAVPSDEDLLRTYDAAKRDHCYDGPINNWPNRSHHRQRAERAATVHGLRAVLARYGTIPTPIPVAERLPGEGDCDAEGRCWIFDEGDAITDPSWNLDNKARLEELKQMEDQGKVIGLCERWNIGWLPFHALPLPAAPGKGA
jgi:hypothetical protein